MLVRYPFSQFTFLKLFLYTQSVVSSPHFIRSPCFIQSAVQIGQYKTQTKPLGYEEMKNPDEKVNIGAVEAKTLYLGRGVGVVYSPQGHPTRI